MRKTIYRVFGRGIAVFTTSIEDDRPGFDRRVFDAAIEDVRNIALPGMLTHLSENCEVESEEDETHVVRNYGADTEHGQILLNLSVDFNGANMRDIIWPFLDSFLDSSDEMIKNALSRLLDPLFVADADGFAQALVELQLTNAADVIALGGRYGIEMIETSPGTLSERVEADQLQPATTN